ncbi:CLUMA_CG001152, isoform A [Clunio marinus]|uniref:CLUMA_CG001152, isoform A n=1 Tax=Clunio marinus TaxID=568069 RepID=A0A1J1HLL9_9DIPT|nr:CLUMA_CG001152, isoform A [Clunio marinus]
MRASYRSKSAYPSVSTGNSHGALGNLFENAFRDGSVLFLKRPDDMPLKKRRFTTEAIPEKRNKNIKTREVDGLLKNLENFYKNFDPSQKRATRANVNYNTRSNNINTLQIETKKTDKRDNVNKINKSKQSAGGKVCKRTKKASRFVDTAVQLKSPGRKRQALKKSYIFSRYPQDCRVVTVDSNFNIQFCIMADSTGLIFFKPSTNRKNSSSARKITILMLQGKLSIYLSNDRETILVEMTAHSFLQIQPETNYEMKNETNDDAVCFFMKDDEN